MVVRNSVGVRILQLLASVLAIGAAATSSFAQYTGLDDTTSTPIPGAGHHYLGFLNETVNPANGSVNVQIDLPVPKGRGLTLPLSLNYNSDGVHHIAGTNPGYAQWQANLGLLSQGGWSYSVPMVNATTWTEQYGSYPNYYNCTATSNYMFSDMSGGQHALHLGTELSTPYGSGICGGGSFGSGGDPTLTASLPKCPPTCPDPLNPNNVNNTPVTVFTPDGTVYNFTNLGGLPPPNVSSLYAILSSIEDRNGNMVTVSSSGQGSAFSFSISDTLGRVAISSSGFGPVNTTNTITLPGNLTYLVSWTSVTANVATIPSQAAGGSVMGTQGDECNSGIPAMNDTQTVISQITLPNGTAYHFHYGTDNSNQTFQNQYGLINEIDYPSGGSVKYAWKLSDTLSELAIYTGANVSSTCGQTYCTTPVPEGCVYEYAAPVLSERVVSFDGTNPALTQTFTSYSTVWGSGLPEQWTAKSVSVTTTDNVTGQSALVSYSYSPIALSSDEPLHGSIPSQVPAESTIKYYDFNGGPLLKTVAKSWINQYQLQSEQTTTENGLTSLITYTYGPFSQLTGKDEYDFGQSVPSRATRIAYEAFLGTPGIIADKPCKVVVYDGTGKPASETDYIYDGGRVVCANPGAPNVASAGGTSLTGHDETNFGPGATLGRGNLTSKIQRNSVGASPATTYAYDETGQITAVTDPNGNTTQYSYGDHFLSTNTGTCQTTAGSPPNGKVTNAYLTQVTRPSTVTSHITTYTYGYNDGELTSSTDENTPANTTTYHYDDLVTGAGCLGRLSETDYPDSGKTTLTYVDTAPSPTITTTKILNSTTNMVSKSIFDGMAHVVQTQLPYDPEGATMVDTSYSGNGWVLSRSNAHRSAPSATDGTTGYTYDGLGRAKVVTEPDGSKVQTTYASSCVPYTNAYGVTVTDEAGNSRTSCSDGLGRLTSVFEDPAGARYETDYQYDPLGNLLKVIQRGGSSQSNWRIRTFAYDWLSRLLSATNPESGTVQYQYDPSGNLVSKTDARGVQTLMTYDVLNRVTSKSYSDGTPPVSFYYDTPPIPWGSPIQNANGRLVEATTGVNPEP